MLDPENAPQPTDPPDNSGGGRDSTSGTVSADDDVELDSSRSLKPTDPPENQGGGT